MRGFVILLLLALAGTVEAQERFRLNSPEAAAAYLRDAAGRSGVGRHVTLREWPASASGRALAVAEWVAEDGVLTRKEMPRDLISVLGADGCTLQGLRHGWLAVVEGVDDADRRVVLGFAASQPAAPPADPAAGRPVGRSFAVVKLAFGDGVHELNIVPVSRSGPGRRSLEVVLAAEPREPQVPVPGPDVAPDALDRSAPGDGAPPMDVRPPPPPPLVVPPPSVPVLPAP